MSSLNQSIVFSKVIPALQADRRGVIAIQYGLSTILRRDREWRTSFSVKRARTRRSDE